MKTRETPEKPLAAPKPMRKLFMIAVVPNYRCSGLLGIIENNLKTLDGNFFEGNAFMRTLNSLREISSVIITNGCSGLSELKSSLLLEVQNDG
jgi:hypothetical protein